MKLNRALYINKIKRELVDERIILDLFAPGRAQFTVVDDGEAFTKNQLVTFDFGYSSQDSLQRWFIGTTDKVVPTGNNKFKVFCREISAALSNPLPLSLRHVSVYDVTAEINTITGVNFSVPDKTYSSKKVANFYNIGSGYMAMNAIGRVFNIPDYIWQQQSGIVYIGGWADSRWASVKNLELPALMFDGHSANESAKIAAIPALRPGIRVNGNRLTSIEFQGSNMVVSWSK